MQILNTCYLLLVVSIFDPPIGTYCSWAKDQILQYSLQSLSLSLCTYLSSLTFHFAHDVRAAGLRWLYNFSSKQRSFRQCKKALLMRTQGWKRTVPSKQGYPTHCLFSTFLIRANSFANSCMLLYLTISKYPSLPSSLYHLLLILQDSP